MNRGLFRSICESIQTENNDKKRLKFEGRYKTSKYIEFEYKKGDEFNGIMKYLSSLTNGNIHDNGTIQITTNSIGNGNPKNLVDYQSDSDFRFSNKSSPNSELCFDFKDKQVQLTSYSIKSYNWSVNDDHLKS